MSMNSPKGNNGVVIPSINNSIEKINKGINDSISKGSIKEFQLIQAYQ